MSNQTRARPGSPDAEDLADLDLVAGSEFSRLKSEAPVAPLAPEVAETPEAAEVELVSLEEADAESGGGKKAAATGDADASDEDDVEVADDGAEDDTFLETDEDEGDDVSDIVGGEREGEEDT